MGRSRKAPRRFIASRLYLDLHAAVLDQAQRAGLTVSDYVAAQLAESTAHPPAPLAKAKGRGRPVTGPRRYVAIRLPVELYPVIVEQARTANLSVSEYVAAQLAEACAHPPAATEPTSQAAA